MTEMLDDKPFSVNFALTLRNRSSSPIVFDCLFTWEYVLELCNDLRDTNS